MKDTFQMKYYVFLDDYYEPETGFEEEQDIEGEKYKELLKFCFERSKYFSFRFFHGRVEIPKHFFDIQLPKNHTCLEWWNEHSRYYIKNGIEICDDIMLLEITSDVKQWIENVSDNLFSWIDASWGFNNPEDPAFYREDGSILFHSVIHEGICELRLTEDEEKEASHILKASRWELKKENGFYPI